MLIKRLCIIPGTLSKHHSYKLVALPGRAELDSPFHALLAELGQLSHAVQVTDDIP